jgi:hypothetical protein
MHAIAHTASVSPRLALVGRIVSGLVVLFLVFDGVAKVLMLPAVIEASTQLGVPESAIAGIGLVLLACTALYVVPPTAVLGAILLTGYLGGATATHVRMGGPVFPVVFAVLVGVLVWGGLYLREPRLHALLPVRR